MSVPSPWGMGRRELELLLWAAALRAGGAGNASPIPAGRDGTGPTPGGRRTGGGAPAGATGGVGGGAGPGAASPDFAALLARLLAQPGLDVSALSALATLAAGSTGEGAGATGGPGFPVPGGAGGLWSGGRSGDTAPGADLPGPGGPSADGDAGGAAGAAPAGSNVAGGAPWPRTALEVLAAAVARRHGLDPALLRAVIQAESGWNPAARSPAGAMGLMQLMPATARELGVADPFDPVQNLEAGARYLRQQFDRFGDWRLALAAYNAGPGAVEAHGGLPPFPETQAYVARVLDLWAGEAARRA